jgi:hypothetical protein
MATSYKIIPKFTPLTPFEIYLQQVKGTFDSIRFQRKDMTYYPPQMGGFFGQREIKEDILVLELTEFEVS